MQSEAVKAHLLDVFDTLKEAARQIRDREGSFMVAEYPQGVIAFRKLEREREYKWKGLPYQFVVLPKDSNDADFYSGGWEDFGAWFKPAGFRFGE